MSPMHSIIKGEEGEVITVLVDGQVAVAQADHPNYAEIKDAVLNETLDGDELLELFDASEAIQAAFEKLSSRVSVANGHVYLDGDEVDTTLTRHIVRAKNEGASFLPLVNFFESAAANPNPESVDQLYDWVQAQGEELSIDSLGRIVGYKGVAGNGNGQLVSCHSGPASDKVSVDGVLTGGGRVPNEVGSTIEMPRSLVDPNPDAACSRGLHVATFGFARGFSSSGGILEVRVAPRDVVSVPRDGNGEKVRCCRYYIAGLAQAPRVEAVVADEDYGDYDDDRPLDW